MVFVRPVLLLFLLICIHLFRCSGKFLTVCEQKGTSSRIVANITCDDELQVFVDGIQAGNTSIDFKSVYSYVIPEGSYVISLICKGKNDSAGRITAGIVGSFDNGRITDTSWKCSNTTQEGWQGRDFNASSWPFAVEHGVNDYSSPPLPWGVVDDVRDGARWIWTQDNSKNDIRVYCRHQLSNATQCRQVDLVRSSGYFTNRETHEDKSLKGSVVMATKTASSTECALRCLHYPECKSINFEYAAHASAKTCELNRNTVGSDQQGLATRKGFIYFDIFEF